MKIILFVALLVSSILAIAQTEKKPSWSEDLPERKDVPKLEIDDEDSDLGGFGLDRSELLGSGLNEELENNSNENILSDTEESVTEQEKIQKRLADIKNQEEQRKKEEQLTLEKQQEAKRLAQEQEARKIAEEQEAKRLAQEQEAKRIAQEQEAKKIADEQAQNLAKKEEENSIKPEQNSPQSKVQTSSTNNKKYSWKKIINAAPNYPRKAARDKKEGWVDVEVEIDSSGSVVNALVVKTYKNSRIFNNESLKAVRKWKFEPPKNYGVQTNLKKTVRLVFKL